MAKTPVKKGAAKAAKAASGEKKKARKTKRAETYGSYIYKVLKQVHPEIGVSKKSMGILNSFVSDVFERIASEFIVFPVCVVCASFPRPVLRPRA